MKKLIALLLAMAMLLSLAACGGEKKDDSEKDQSATEEKQEEKETEEDSEAESEEPSETEEASETEEPSETETEEPTETEETSETETEEVSEDEEVGMRGTVDGTVYENPYLGFGCALEDGWDVYNDQELGALMGMTASMITDDDLKNALENSGVAYLFYASNNGGLQTINILMENVGILGSNLTAETYIEASMPTLEQTLPAAGFSNVVLTSETVMFAGQEMPAILVEGEYMGMPVYEILVPIVQGSNVVCTTIASFNTNDCAAILEAFFPMPL